MLLAENIDKVLAICIVILAVSVASLLLTFHIASKMLAYIKLIAKNGIQIQQSGAVAPAPSQAPTAQTASASQSSDGVSDEVVAAITAAIAIATDNKPFIIKNIQKA
ncbi:MAG: hypothetical protein LBN25_01430 [Christensenellaceae bacterium]|jgi:hypothetical protein|nr:hypothetical protein [Christensenellaceae bacterium]